MPVIGVALPVPEPWGSELQRYRVALGDRLATAIPTHVTLVPPVHVDDDQLEVVCRHLEAVTHGFSAFEVHLRGTGTFRPVSPVVFVSLVEGISQTEQLAAAVRRGPLAVELPFPFHPHVTIAHHLEDDVMDRAFKELADFECAFEADAFHLYVHETGVGWQPTQAFPLVPRSATQDKELRP